MENASMRCICPQCANVLDQDRNTDGLNYCPNCRNLFLIAAPRPVPPWVLGVVTVLLMNWQILFWHACH
jgi:hypothetical protein